MRQQEQSRSEVIRLYVDGYIKQKEAAKRMGLNHYGSSSPQLAAI